MIASGLTRISKIPLEAVCGIGGTGRRYSKDGVLTGNTTGEAASATTFRIRGGVAEIRRSGHPHRHGASVHALVAASRNAA